MAELEIVATDPGDYIYAASLPEDDPLYIFLPGSEFVLLSKNVLIQRVGVVKNYVMILGSAEVTIQNVAIEREVDYELQAEARNVEIGNSDLNLTTVEFLEAGSRLVLISRESINLQFTYRIFTAASRALNILNAPIDGYLVDTSVFPSLRPTTRRFVPPKHAIYVSSSQNGTKVRTLIGNTPANSELALSYENIPNTTAAEILSIFDRHDTIKPVELPAEVFAGSSGSLQTQQDLSASDLDWFFAAPPTVRSVITGISSVDLSFRGRRKSLASISGLFVPIDAAFTVPADTSTTSGTLAKCADGNRDSDGGGGLILPGDEDTVTFTQNSYITFRVGEWSASGLNWQGFGQGATTASVTQTIYNVTGPVLFRAGYSTGTAMYWIQINTFGDVPAVYGFDELGRKIYGGFQIAAPAPVCSDTVTTNCWLELNPPSLELIDSGPWP